MDFKIANLMAIKPKTRPVSVIKADVDLDFVHGPAADGISDDIIEIDQARLPWHRFPA